MPQKKRLLNYFLSMAVILLVVVFLLSLVSISRYVMDDSALLSSHVNDTKNLLENVDEVSKAAERQERDNRTLITKEGAFLRLQYKGFNVTDVAYKNVHENKSIFTVIMDESIEERDGIYYVGISNYSRMAKGDVVAYEEDGEVVIGEYVDIEEGRFIFREVGTTNLVEIQRSRLLGYVIFQEE